MPFSMYGLLLSDTVNKSRAKYPTHQHVAAGFHVL